MLRHATHLNGMAAGQGNIDCFKCVVPMGGVQRDAWQRGSHLHTLEASLARSLFARFKQRPSYALSRKCRMREKCANTRWVASGVEQNIVPRVIVVAGAIKRAAFAPAAASANLAANLGNIVRAVVNELHVHAKNRMNGCLNLFSRIPACLQLAHGSFDEVTENWNIVSGCNANEDGGHTKPIYLIMDA